MEGWDTGSHTHIYISIHQNRMVLKSTDTSFTMPPTAHLVEDGGPPGHTHTHTHMCVFQYKIDLKINRHSIHNGTTFRSSDCGINLT